MFIYKIHNNKTNQAYVGSAKDPISRWKIHMRNLKKESHNKIFCEAWKNSDIIDWSFQVLERTTEEERYECEQKWINSMGSLSLNAASALTWKRIKDEVKAEARRMLADKVPYRTISKQTGMSLGAVSMLASTNVSAY